MNSMDIIARSTDFNDGHFFFGIIGGLFFYLIGIVIIGLFSQFYSEAREGDITYIIGLIVFGFSVFFIISEVVKHNHNSTLIGIVTGGIIFHFWIFSSKK